MIVHKTAEFKHEVSPTSYTRKVWKPNHVIFGRKKTEGCWNTVHCGKQDREHGERLQRSIALGAKLTGLDVDHFRYFFFQADAAFTHIYMEGSLLRVYTAGKWHEFNKTNTKELIKLLKAKNWYGTVAKPAQATSAKSATLKTVSTCSMTGAATKSVLTGKQKKFINAGLKLEDYAEFNKWRKENEAVIFGTSVSQKVKMFYGEIPLEPLALVRAGLKAEDAQAFFEFARKQSIEDGIKPMHQRVKAFYENLPVVVTLLCDAHVLEYRRTRANRLKALRRVAVRDGQGLFRLHVLANFGGVCCISGMTADVEAAHIIPHAYSAYQHADNGLPLAKFLHSAFDTGLFTVHPVTLTVVVAEHARAFLNIHGKQIADGQIWPIDRSALANHYEQFMEASND